MHCDRFLRFKDFPRCQGLRLGPVSLLRVSVFGCLSACLRSVFAIIEDERSEKLSNLECLRMSAKKQADGRTSPHRYCSMLPGIDSRNGKFVAATKIFLKKKFWLDCVKFA